MRVFHIKNIDFCDNLGSIDFSIYQVPFTLIFNNDELEGMEHEEITDEICYKLRLLFGFHDVYFLDYCEVFSLGELSMLTKLK